MEGSAASRQGPYSQSPNIRGLDPLGFEHDHVAMPRVPLVTLERPLHGVELTLQHLSEPAIAVEQRPSDPVTRFNA